MGDARFQKALSEADKRLSTDDLEGAIRVYESVLDGTPKTAEAHYRLGHVYADRLKEPLGALYHFNRYVAVAPDGAAMAAPAVNVTLRRHPRGWH